MVEPQLQKDVASDSKGFIIHFNFEVKFRKSYTTKGIQCTSFIVQPSATNPPIILFYIAKSACDSVFNLGLVHFPSQPKIFPLPPITSNLSTHAWSIKCR
jgi:hypothetical protein